MDGMALRVSLGGTRRNAHRTTYVKCGGRWAKHMGNGKASLFLNSWSPSVCGHRNYVYAPLCMFARAHMVCNTRAKRLRRALTIRSGAAEIDYRSCALAESTPMQAHNH